MLAEVGTTSFAISSGWAAIAGAAAATPLIGFGIKRLFDTYTKSDVVKLIDDAVEPIKEIIDKNTDALEKVEDLLTDVRIGMARRRSSDGDDAS